MGERGPLPGGEALVEAFMILLRVFLVLAWLFLPVTIVYLIISPKFRRRMLRRLISSLSFIASVYILARILPDLFGDRAWLSGMPS